MAPNRRGKEQHVIPTDRAMTGILALLVEERERRMKEDETATKTEVLLGDAGLTNEDIAAVTGKRADTVRIAIMRARKSKR